MNRVVIKGQHRSAYLNVFRPFPNNVSKIDFTFFPFSEGMTFLHINNIIMAIIT
jgi:hypothetical protein